MKNKLSALVEILPWLILNRGVSAQVAANHFQISKKELLDLLQLAVLTGPGQGGGELVDIDFDDEECLIVFDAKGLERPIKFEIESALEIMSGLQYLSQLPGVIDSTDLENLIAKLENAFGIGERPLEIIEDSKIKQIDEVIGLALKEKSVVQITYSAGNSGLVSSRTIEPKTFVLKENIKYIEAWCHAALSIRTFRMERILSAEKIDRFQEHSDDQDRSRVNSLIEVQLDCSSHALLEIDPSLIVSKTQLPNSRYSIVLLVFDLNWISREVMGSNGEIVAIGPKALTDLVSNQIGSWRKANLID